MALHSIPAGPLRLAPDPTQRLSTWLEEQGFELNTRCGGRGLCRGCEVRLVASAAADVSPMRSCQVRLGDLPEDVVRVEIPPASQRDRTLHGVTVFELRGSSEVARQVRNGLGLAVDVGTTTVAAALWDLRSGRCLAEGARANAQIPYGDNVLSRISFSLDRPDGLAILRACLVDKTVRPLAEDLLGRAGATAADLVDVRAAGNPAMLHILAHESLVGLATYPFRPAFLGGRVLDVPELGWPVPWQLLPGLGPFVGADIVAGALAGGMLAGEAPLLLIDFGTNGEILLRSRNGWYATATAAGPAFEGGRLACGAPAGPGVISALERRSGRWHAIMSGGMAGPARALSGAAYIDALALGQQEGWINAAGRLEAQSPAVARVEAERPGTALRVAITPEVFFTEADIAELLQAKAAMAAGVKVLLELADCPASELEAVLVAGGFGYHLRPAHAMAIGLLPTVPLDRIALLGNTSLGGTSLVLQRNATADLDELARRVTIVELNQQPGFEDHYTDSLGLEPFG